MEVDSESEAVVVPPAEDKLTPPVQIFSFDLLKTARANQDANGLRHNDHYRYRQYCTRRLQRLYKAAKRGHGKGRWKKETPILEIKCEQDLEILLVQTERNWSFFQQLKGDNAVRAAFSSASKQHSVRKLRKASSCAKVLHKFSLHTCDLRTQRETEAYQFYMDSLLLMEQENFAAAAKMLEKCRSAYERLAAASKDPDLYKTMVEEVDPLLKRCKHNAGVLNQEASKQSTSSSITKVDDVEMEEIVETYSFRGQKIDCTSGQTKEKLDLAFAAVEKARGKVLATSSTTTTTSGASSSSTSAGGKMNASSITTQSAVEQIYAEGVNLMQDALASIHEEMLRKGDKVAALEKMCREQLTAICVERDLLFLERLGAKIDGLSSIEQLGAKGARPEEGVRFAELIKSQFGKLESEELEDGLADVENLLMNLRGFFVALCYLCCGKYAEASGILELIRGRMEMQQTEEPLTLPEPFQQATKILNTLRSDLPNRAMAWHARSMVLSVPGALDEPGATSGQSSAAPLLSSTANNQLPGTVFPNVPLELLHLPPIINDLAELELPGPNLEEFLPKKQGKIKGALNKIGGALGGLWGRGRG
ncbi:unnamed protein product [Amoebophrya sp. A120]|nr:unnamed protein product [Amoebophrya sp. A120]|eukprot:GSA120T00000281001.1